MYFEACLATVPRWEAYANAIIPTKRDDVSFISPRNILDVVRATIKWMASFLCLDPEYFSLHSISAGGASALFSNGIEFEIVRRLGRWRSDQSHVYLYGDSLNFRKPISALRQERT